MKITHILFILFIGFTLSANAQIDTSLCKEIELDSIEQIENEILRRADGGEILKRVDVGATSKINGDAIKMYPDIVLTNSLQGKVAGLQVRSIAHGLGNNAPELYVRGLHGMSNNTALVIIDGVERPLADMLAEEIESIEVLKDATAKILYGARATNGVLCVKTKRGVRDTHIYNVSAEVGVSQVTRLPEYLNSHQYASLYNEARLNDGLTAFYSQEDLDGYLNSSGVNDLLYPDVDYFDEFLNKSATYKKVSFEMTGGSSRTRYAIIAGYISEGGLDNGSYKTNLNRITLRGNLDFDVNDIITVSADVAGRLELRKFGQLNNSGVFSALNNHRPNEYPFVIEPSFLGLEPREDGIPYFGASATQSTNLYAEMMYGGYADERYTLGQSTLGIDFNLDKLTDGLEMGTSLSFDSNENLDTKLAKTYPTYSIDPFTNSAGVQDYRITTMKEEDIPTAKSRTSTALSQTLGWNSYLAYSRAFNLHNIDARMGYSYNKQSNQGDTQDVKNSNNTFRLNYNYDSCYILEGSLALMGSNRFAKGNRHFASYAIGGGWIISNEEFCKSASNINFLKLKASFGVLGFDRSTDYMLHEQSYDQSGSFSFGSVNNGSTAYLTTIIRRANDNLKWERSTEYNIGVEGLFFGNRLFAEVNYFRELRSNIIESVSSTYANYVGDFTYVDNVGEVFNQGVEIQLNWGGRVGDLTYKIGVNTAWTRNEVREWNQVVDGEEYRYVTGNSTDAMFGLVSDGLFLKNVDIRNHPQQTFGNYQNGDIAYRDINGDEVIDNRDKMVLGNSFPRVTNGLEIDLNYKGWGLFINAYSELGVDGWKNNSYYWNSGEDKYSVEVLERYHPTNNPSGSYPRLTTTTGSNNFINSSFWLADQSFFRLKNVEASYTFSNLSKLKLDKLKIFARATNLFVLSSIDELDPEVLDAGVVNYPILRHITAGASFVF